MCTTVEKIQKRTWEHRTSTMLETNLECSAIQRETKVPLRDISSVHRLARAEVSLPSFIPFELIFSEQQNQHFHVMLKNALYTVNPLRLSTGLFLCGSLPAPTFSRYLSTNSAINKGLRKSKDGRSRLDPPARLGGITRRAESHRRVDEYKHGRASSSLRNNRRSEYGREPGGFRHARSDSRPQPRSSDEREPSVTTRKRSPTLRERRTFKAMDGNTSRSRHEPAHDFPRRSPVSNPTFSSSARSEHRMGRHRMESASLNRAERRAAAFGHKEKPPEGYKALPIVSEEEGNRSPKDLGDGRTAMRQHSSINGRAKYGAGANTKDYGEEKRWADRPARRNGLDGSEGKYKEDIDERPRRKSNAPLAIPYTTSASEFLYGHSVVSAALKFSRRKFYKLYLYNGDSAEVRGQDREVRKLALAANVEVTRVGHDWLSLMDKMSGGRPHNVRKNTWCDQRGKKLTRCACRVMSSKHRLCQNYL